MASTQLKDQYKENWYALLIAILAEEELTVEESLAVMRVKMSRGRGRRGNPSVYLSLRERGYTWERISSITGVRNPRTITEKFLKKSKNF